MKYSTKLSNIIIFLLGQFVSRHILYLVMRLVSDECRWSVRTSYFVPSWYLGIWL